MKLFSKIGNVLKGVNWLKVGEWVGFIGGGGLTILGTWCGTVNAAKEHVDELLEESAKAINSVRKEEEKES